MPFGKLVSSLLLKVSVFRENIPSKSPAFKEVIDALDRSRLLIIAISVSVTALQSLTPAAFAIAIATASDAVTDIGQREGVTKVLCG